MKGVIKYSFILLALFFVTGCLLIWILKYTSSKNEIDLKQSERYAEENGNTPVMKLNNAPVMRSDDTRIFTGKKCPHMIPDDPTAAKHMPKKEEPREDVASDDQKSDPPADLELRKTMHFNAIGKERSVSVLNNRNHPGPSNLDADMMDDPKLQSYVDAAAEFIQKLALINRKLGLDPSTINVKALNRMIRAQNGVEKRMYEENRRKEPGFLIIQIMRHTGMAKIDAFIRELERRLGIERERMENDALSSAEEDSMLEYADIFHNAAMLDEYNKVYFSNLQKYDMLEDEELWSMRLRNKNLGEKYRMSFDSIDGENASEDQSCDTDMKSEGAASIKEGEPQGLAANSNNESNATLTEQKIEAQSAAETRSSAANTATFIEQESASQNTVETPDTTVDNAARVRQWIDTQDPDENLNERGNGQATPGGLDDAFRMAAPLSIPILEENKGAVPAGTLIPASELDRCRRMLSQARMASEVSTFLLNIISRIYRMRNRDASVSAFKMCVHMRQDSETETESSDFILSMEMDGLMERVNRIFVD